MAALLNTNPATILVNKNAAPYSLKGGIFYNKFCVEARQRYL